MGVKVNRNDLCPCGSGKKYKKCCGANEAVSITEIIDSEMDELQQQIVHFAFWHYGGEIQADFEELEEMLDFDDEEERDFYQFFHSIWFPLFVPLEDDVRIIEKFIATEARKIKRTKLRQILHTWTEARVIAGKIIEINGNKLSIENGLTMEKLEAVIPSPMSDVEVGSFFIGFIMPYEQKYVFFPGPITLSYLSPALAYKYLEESRLQACYESAEEYLTDFFFEVMKELPMIGSRINIDSMEWPAPVLKEVAEIFQQKLSSLEELGTFIDMGVILWFEYCKKIHKRIQNPKLYAAALHYLVSTIVSLRGVYTQKEMGDHYHVSPRSFSSIYREMDEVLEEEIKELIGFEKGDELGLLENLIGPVEDEEVLEKILSDLEEEDFDSIEEISEFLERKMKEYTKKRE